MTSTTALSCVGCNKVKPLAAKAKRLCRACYDRQWRLDNPEKRQAIQLRHDYGIDAAEYARLFALQAGACAICCTPQTALEVSLAVDHHHVSKKVRGLLCNGCNTAIGLCREEKVLFAKVASYLRLQQYKLEG